MKTLALILPAIGAVHAGSLVGHLDYNAEGTVDGERYINQQWAEHSQGISHGHVGSTPTPHPTFGTYVCDGYYQSPIDLPRTSIQKKHKANQYVAEDVSDDQKVYAVYKSADMIGVQRDYKNDTDGTPIYSNYVGIPAEYAGLNNITLPSGAVYSALQFHWHYASEHTIDGMRYPSELHIVHQRTVTGNDPADKGFLVLGFFISTGSQGGSTTVPDNLWHLLNDYDLGAGAIRRIGSPTETYNLKTIFGGAMQGNYMRYQGGLTTPPCSEAVEWFVFETPLYVSRSAFTDTGSGKHGCRDSISGVDCETDPTKTGNTRFHMNVPIAKRSNRPLTAIHGRDIQRNKLTSVPNPTGGTTYNYKRPADMWATTNCNTSGCATQCQNSVTSGVEARQSPINLQGTDAFRGVMPVNTLWLQDNTVGYVDANTASAARWQIKNTGHGFNVIPSFQEAGVASSLPHSYFVKMVNAAGTDTYYYKLHQFHVHFPSEHTVDGRQYDGELHMVHVYDEASHANITAKIAAEVAAKGGAAVSTASTASDVVPPVVAAGGHGDHAHGGAGRVLKEKNGEKTVIFDGDQLGVQKRRSLSGDSASGIDAVVLGFFLSRDHGSGNILNKFSFDSKTGSGAPYAKGDSWPVDVDAKGLMEILFGSDHLHTRPDADHVPGADDFTSPDQRDYFKYYGGLTTPGCTEGVQFIIFTQPLKVTSDQIELFQQNYFANNRPTQPVGDRKVLFNDMNNPNVSPLKMDATNKYAITPPPSVVSALTSNAAPTGISLVAGFLAFLAICKMA